MTAVLVLVLLLMTSSARTARWTALVLWPVIAGLVWQGAPYTERPILGAWWIESNFEVFDPAQMNERANVAVELQPITEPDGTTRLRFKMTCPKCGQQPVYRQDRIDAALAALYVKGADSKIVQYAI